MIETPQQALGRLMTMTAINQRGVVLLAQKVGRKVSQSTVSEFLSGKYQLDIETAKTFGLIFNVSPLTFLPELAEARPPASSDDQSLQRIPLHLLFPSPLNPRRTFDAEALEGLASSIAGPKGLLQNLVVRPRPGEIGFWIVAGERRYRALNLLVATERLPANFASGIPCNEIEADDSEHVLIALTENMQREDPNPMEEAEAFAKLQALDPEKWTPRYMAERIGKTQRHVQLRLALVNKLTEEAQEKLRSGAINLAAARMLTAFPTETQAGLIETQDLTAAAIKRKISWSIPADRALFDLETSGLEVSEDPDTEQRFVTDREGFVERQRAALEEMAERLRQEKAPAFVKIIDQHALYSHDTGGKGIVITLGYDGEYQVYEDRKECRYAQKVQSPADKSRWDTKQRIETAQREAGAKWVLDLAVRLEPADVIALIVTDALSSHDAKCLNRWGHGLFWRLPKWCGNGAADAIKAEMIFDSASDENVINNMVLVNIIGSQLKQPGPQSQPHPILLRLAEKHGVKLPAILTYYGAVLKKALDRAASGQFDIEDFLAQAGAPPTSPDQPNDEEEAA